MSTATEIVYPSSDGEPMADNSRQAQWMLALLGNLDALLDCFVGCNNFWFPVEGEPHTRLAPDVYVAFGRPKGHRNSYQQWKEAGVPVTVVFEIWSPGNNIGDLEEKYTFYTEHGVDEYYIYDPYRNYLEVYLRRGTALRRVWDADGFVSPRMGVRFDLSGEDMVLWRPDGRRFSSFAELDEAFRHAEEARRLAELARDLAEAERRQAEEARLREEAARQQAEANLHQEEAARQKAEANLHEEEAARQKAEANLHQEEAARHQAEANLQQEEAARQQAEANLQQEEAARQQAEANLQQEEAARQQAEEAQQQAEAARRQAETRLARVLELSRKARRGLASADELAELDRLEGAD